MISWSAVSVFWSTEVLQGSPIFIYTHHPGVEVSDQRSCIILTVNFFNRFKKSLGGSGFFAKNSRSWSGFKPSRTPALVTGTFFLFPCRHQDISTYRYMNLLTCILCSEIFIKHLWGRVLLKGQCHEIFCFRGTDSWKKTRSKKSRDTVPLSDLHTLQGDMTGTRGSACPAWRCTTLSRTSGRRSATCPLAAAAPGSGYSTAFSTGAVQLLLFLCGFAVGHLLMYIWKILGSNWKAVFATKWKGHFGALEGPSLEQCER